MSLDVHRVDLYTDTYRYYRDRKWTSIGNDVYCGRGMTNMKVHAGTKKTALIDRTALQGIRILLKKWIIAKRTEFQNQFDRETLS